ncbi:unnamed protein product [Haemonchus placei]|uniref:Mediator of RNA polymerase II transcription subunit 4 n=1 Tax=Haemonchus placei TaxID=6290 RepID=A0A0N4WKK6_HAEPC|nr:unnamed protein product [Haemonchus placei]
MVAKLGGKPSWLTCLSAISEETLSKNLTGSVDDSKIAWIVRMRSLIQECQELDLIIINLRNALDSYMEAADKMQKPLNENQIAKIEEKVKAAQTIYLSGQNYLIELPLLLERNADISLPEPISDGTLKPRLAPLQLPSFKDNYGNGNISGEFSMPSPTRATSAKSRG